MQLFLEHTARKSSKLTTPSLPNGTFLCRQIQSAWCHLSPGGVASCPSKCMLEEYQEEGHGVWARVRKEGGESRKKSLPYSPHGVQDHWPSVQL
jgi:hypothetical protein